MIPRIALASLVVLLAVPATVVAQKPPPTVADVLQRFAAGEDSEALNRAGDDATRLLRQEHGSITEEEIGALIEGLIELALAPEAGKAGDRVGYALVSAARSPGTYADGFGYITADDLRGVARPGGVRRAGADLRDARGAGARQRRR